MRELIESLLVTVLLALFGTTFVVQAFKIPSQSMEPTLLVGDHLLVNKFLFGGRGHWYDAVLPYRDVRRRDVIVFKFPFQDHPHYVKRVIGLPGDRVALRDGQVFIDGKALALQADGTGLAENDDGSHMPARRLIETLPDGRTHTIFKLTPLQPLDNMAETVVLPGHVFVMGDNRDNSADSRVPLREGGVGMLPVDDLVGRVDGIVGSWDLGMKSRPVWTWPQGLRLSRFFSAVY